MKNNEGKNTPEGIRGRSWFIGLFLLGVVALSFHLSRRATAPIPHRHLESNIEIHRPLKTVSRGQVSQPSLPPKIVYVTNQFNWSQVESSDYRQYIANLRAIGCPETTIKDIIFTDILKLYAARRGKYYQNGREFRFWETDEKRKLNARQLEEREKQLALIDKEIPAVLRELLGVNYEREMNKYFVDSNEDERRLSFLPEEKRDQLLALRDQIEGMRERVMDRANGNPSEADLEELKKIDERQKAELKNILSGSELAEFELRTSDTANELRANLIGFNPSESEFREIFEMEKAVNAKFAYADPNDEAVQQKKAEAEADVQETLKRQWGDARYAEYQRSQNPDYRNACVFTEVYELPTSTAQAIFEIQQVAEAERQNLLKNTAVEESARLEALRAIQNETEKALRATMGANVFAKYTQSTGKWVRSLGAY